MDEYRDDHIKHSKLDKDKYHMVSLIVEFEKKGINKLIYKTE